MLTVVENPSTLPKDPLYKTEYAYSVLNTLKEFQISGTFESERNLALHRIGGSESIAASESSLSPFVQEANAATTTKLGYAALLGSYNGMVAKVTTGSTLYILAIPSLITYDATLTSVESLAALSINPLVLNRMNNLPFTYANSDLLLSGSSNTISTLSK